MIIKNMRSRFWILPVGVATAGIFLAAFFFSTRSVAAPTIVWTPSSITGSITPGQTQVVPASFTASENMSNAVVRVDPSLQSVLKLLPSNLANIQNGQTVALNLVLSASSTALPGSFQGAIRLLVGSTAIADPLPVSVTVVPVGLPPDPGEAGKATVEGIDSNGNGVRDDLERWIVINYPASEKLRAGLFQQAKAFQRLLIVGRDKDVANALSADSQDEYANSCLIVVLGSVDEKIGVSRMLFAETLNTRARTLAYLDYNDLLAGKVLRGGPADDKLGCAFNPDTMRN